MEMYKIKTKEKVKYDMRDNLHGFVFVSMNYRVIEGGYIVTITDFVEHTKMVYDEVNDSEIPAISREVLKTKTFNFSNAQLNGMMGMISDLPTGYTREDEDMRHRLVLLAYVQNDWNKDENGDPIVGKTIYDLTPNDWELA